MSTPVHDVTGRAVVVHLRDRRPPRWINLYRRLERFLVWCFVLVGSAVFWVTLFLYLNQGR